jgi:hypothetical protein
MKNIVEKLTGKPGSIQRKPWADYDAKMLRIAFCPDDARIPAPSPIIHYALRITHYTSSITH